MGFRDPGRYYQMGHGGWWRWDLGFIKKWMLGLTNDEYLFFEYFKQRVFYCVRTFRSNLQMRTLRL